MRNEQPMQDQPKDPGQQKRWYAYIDSEMVGGYLASSPFTWRGFAHSESDAIAKAMRASEFTLRAFDALDQRPPAGAAPFPASALRVEVFPEGYVGRYDLAHALSVAGAPFIQPGGAEAQFCLAATRPSFKPDRVDYKIAAQIMHMMGWLLTLDSEVCRVLSLGESLTVRWGANVDVLRRPHSPPRPYREVGFNVCDRDGVAVAVHESTANAILMLMLATRGTRGSWATFRPLSLSTTWVARLYNPSQEELKQKSIRLLANPGRRLSKILLNLLMSGHTELAAHVAAMADPTEPRVSAPIAEDTKTAKVARAAVPVSLSAANPN